MKNSKKILVTHNGSFHTDDVFACAALSLLLEREKIPFEIIRTRDENLIKKADYVFDVGGVYGAEQNRFDHHQSGGAGKRDNGIEYSSFGLIWKKFGEKLAESREIAELLDKKLVQPIDAWDNGFDLVENKHEISPYYLQHIFFAMEPTWRENDLKKDEVFLKCVEIARIVLSREIIQTKDTVLAEKSLFSIYKSSEDKRIIVLDQNYPFEYILHKFPEPLFVVYPRSIDNSWGVKAVKQDPKTFKNRKDLPKPWGGLRGEELTKISGVSDAVFCHRGLFMAVAKSKEGAIKLAQIALQTL